MTRFAIALFKLSRICARGTAPGAEAKLQSQCSCWEQAAGEGGAAQGGLSQRLRLSQAAKGSRAGRPPCGAWPAPWSCWWDPGSFCPDGVGNPASDPEGKEQVGSVPGEKERVPSTGSEAACKAWLLLVSVGWV